MNQYTVVVEVRPVGALGVFDWHAFNVLADSEERARETALYIAHNVHDYETRGVLVGGAR